MLPRTVPPEISVRGRLVIADGALIYPTLEISRLRKINALSSSGNVPMNLWDVNHASRRSQVGVFSVPSSAAGAKCRDMLTSRASAGERGLSAQGDATDRIGYR